ncbi:hypothetical protein M8J75_003404 [Diaphorina citri]|nr:hypothetical protein M8J75_003404 [Diaphorina citri]KAI5728369.1 hypothetical protein M8J77_015355 [Diaphorina citri]
MEESGSGHAAEEQIARVINELYQVTNQTYRLRRELYHLAETPPPTPPSRSSMRSPTGPHIPDDPLSFVVFLAFFFVFGCFVLGFLVERRLSDIFGCSVSDALARHVARTISGDISDTVVTTSSEPPCGPLRTGPGCGAHPTWTPHQHHL